MTLQALYDNLHGDLADASKRLINEKMVARFVVRFVDDTSMQQLRDAVAANDIETSFRAIHTLKGLAGVLALTPLYEAAWNLTEQLRPRIDPADEKLLEIVEEKYKECVSLIKEFEANQEPG